MIQSDNDQESSLNHVIIYLPWVKSIISRCYDNYDLYIMIMETDHHQRALEEKDLELECRDSEVFHAG